jgi:hypothetical protein
MITFVLTIEESEAALETNGTVVGLKASRREEELMGGLMKAIERYCVKERMPVSGGAFVRSEWPIKNGKRPRPA